MTKTIDVTREPRSMEPLFPDSARYKLAGLSCAILREAGGLERVLPSPVVRGKVVTLVQEMNSYPQA